MKQSTVDGFFIGEKLHISQSKVMQMKSGAVPLDSQHSLLRKPHHDRGETPAVKTGGRCPKIAQSRRRVSRRGLKHRHRDSLAGIPSHQHPGKQVIAKGAEENELTPQERHDLPQVL